MKAAAAVVVGAVLVSMRPSRSKSNRNDCQTQYHPPMHTG